MKKALIFLSLLILFSHTGFAQTKNVDLDNVNLAYAYREQPSAPLKPIYFTYAVKVNINGVQKDAISEDELIDRSSIAEQVKVYNPSEANVLLELTIGNIIVTKREIKERKVETKDKKTGEVKTSYYYKVVVKYTFESSYLVRKGQEVLLKGNPYTTLFPLSYESKEYNDQKSANAFWDDNKNALLSQFYRDLALKSAASLTDAASKRFGFPAKTNAREVIKTMDEKKHTENEAFRAAGSALKEALTTMTPDFPLDQEKVYGLIEYYKTIPERYTDPAHKADIRLRYAAWFNICKIYMFLDEPEKVVEYADLLIKNGYDTKDGLKLIQEAEELQSIFDKTGIRTRHFSPEIYFSSEE